MIKKFLEWVHSKIYIDEKPRGKIIHMCEVYWCALGENIGDEENGKGDAFTRPVLIIKKFNNHMFWVIPLSTKQKKFDFYFNYTDPNNQKVSAILAQMKLLSVKRLKRKLYDIPNKLFDEMRQKLKSFL